MDYTCKSAPDAEGFWWFKGTYPDAKWYIVSVEYEMEYFYSRDELPKRFVYFDPRDETAYKPDPGEWIGPILPPDHFCADIRSHYMTGEG